MQHTFLAGALIALGWGGLGRFFPQNSATDILMIAAAIMPVGVIAKSAWQALRFRVLGIPALVTLAALGGHCHRRILGGSGSNLLICLWILSGGPDLG